MITLAEKGNTEKKDRFGGKKLRGFFVCFLVNCLSW